MPISSFFMGSPGQQIQLERFTPAQKSAQNKMLQQSQAGLEEAGNLSFEPIAEQRKKEFFEKIVPSIAERFVAGDADRSSAFRQQLGAAGSDLETNLAALQSQYGLDKFQLMQQLAGLGMQPQFENLYSPEQPGALQGVGQGLAAAAPSILSGLMGGRQAPGAGLTSNLAALAGKVAPAAAGLAGKAAPAVAGAVGKAAPRIGALAGLGALGPAAGVIGGGLGFMALLRYLVRRKKGGRGRRR